jgi:hypothetical protein
MLSWRLWRAQPALMAQARSRNGRSTQVVVSNLTSQLC